MAQRFADFPLDGRIAKGIDATVGESARLTRVQQLIFQCLLGARRDAWPDLLMRAHTGTGKTLAFLVPALQRLLARSERGPLQEGVLVLVVAPTRELVLQIDSVARGLLQHAGPAVRSSFVAGGFSLAEDVERLRADLPHLLVGTPGRLSQHLLKTPNFVRALHSVELVVLDEADRLLDSKFVYQVDYIVRCLSREVQPQTILCSATFGDAVRKFAFRSMRTDFLKIEVGPEVGGGKDAPLGQGEVGEVSARVDQLCVRYQPEDLTQVLLGTLQQELRSADGSARRVLVLFPTVRWLQFCYVLLKHRAGLGSVWALHGQLADDKRRARVALFSRGAPPVHGALFATDVAARGLDLDVDAVIQVGPPADREQYVHRAGRTGRLTARGRSLLLLHPLEAEAVLAMLQGLPIRVREAASVLSSPPRGEADAAAARSGLPG